MFQKSRFGAAPAGAAQKKAARVRKVREVAERLGLEIVDERVKTGAHKSSYITVQRDAEKVEDRISVTVRVSDHDASETRAECEVEIYHTSDLASIEGRIVAALDEKAAKRAAYRANYEACTGRSFEPTAEEWNAFVNSCRPSLKSTT
jgi:hypothetical protein